MDQSWITIRTRQDIMDIVEVVGPKFKDRIVEGGIAARFINIDNINYSQQIGSRQLDIPMVVHFSSDQGKLEQSLLLRQFSTNELYIEEITTYNTLDKRIMRQKDIYSFPIIHYDENLRFVLYELVEGYDLKQLAIPDESKHYFLGKIFATLQGDEAEYLDENVVREYMIFLLMNLPFSDEERESIIQLLEKHFAKIKNARGGYTLDIEVSPNNMKFHPIGENFSIVNIKQGNSLMVSIGPSKYENLMKDRMFDIAAVFSDMAFNEYVSSGDIIHTKLQLASFIQGYHDVNEGMRLPKMKELYADGLTLDMQFVSQIWLNELEKVKSVTQDQDNFDSMQVLLYTYFLLNQSPFANVFGIY